MRLKNTYNYIAAFLTMRCCYKCSYCINWKSEWKEKSGKEWVEFFKDVQTDLPVTLCGGEPTLHKDFLEIASSIPQKIDLLTNLNFDVSILKDLKDRFDNTRSFAPIRVSFHPEFMDRDETIEKMWLLEKMGLRAALYCVEPYKFDAPNWLDFQTKPRLDNTVKEEERKTVECLSHELLLGPDLNIYRCHRDLYKQENPLKTINEGSILNKCKNGNECHPCDLKVKRDRFGKFGYQGIERK